MEVKAFSALSSFLSLTTGVAIFILANSVTTAFNFLVILGDLLLFGIFLTKSFQFLLQVSKQVDRLQLQDCPHPTKIIACQLLDFKGKAMKFLLAIFHPLSLEALKSRPATLNKISDGGSFFCSENLVLEFLFRIGL